MRARHKILCNVLLPVVLCGAAVPASAQRAPALTLKPATAKLDEPFSSIAGIRELADGRLLITDDRERRLVLADLRANTVTPAGRTGSGPGEYRVPRPVLALKGDSGLMADGLRWLLFDGARIAQTLSRDAPGAGGTGPAAAIGAVPGDVFAADAIGFVYVRLSPRPSGPGGTTANDSALLARVARTTGRADTIARLRTSPRTLKTAVMQGSTVERLTPLPFPLEDEARPFPDGSVAVVRAESYRVDWRTSAGRMVEGAPIPVTLASVTERDKQAIMDLFPTRPGRMPQFDFSAFPAKVPPFQSGALVAAPDGRLLIRRTPTASETATRYDIVDRKSRLVAQLTMPKNQWIAGVGKGAVYVAEVDADGIQRLEKHPWP